MTPKGRDNYDPTYKYYYIYNKIIHNINFLSKHNKLDQTCEETSFATASPGNKVSDVIFRVQLHT